MKSGIWALCTFLGLAACEVPARPTLQADGDGDADADADGDTDVDHDEPGCVDQDGDGWGFGASCTGDDCDDGDDTLTNDCGNEAVCAEGSHLTGCPCTEQQPLVCYTGPADTADVGPCRSGLRACVDGLYGPCDGEVGPHQETCDDVDQDCDGAADDGVRSECGTCSADCRSEAVGVGTENPFDVESPRARGVVQMPDGALTVGGPVVRSNRMTWIASSAEGTVEKIDTETNQEMGRYYTDHGHRGDPAGPTVNPHGDAITVNRETSTVTFILASDCPDVDGDGAVETSSGPDDVLPFEEDECIGWNLPIFGGGARGTAIQERLERDGSLHEYAWVGALFSGDVYEIDVEAGELTGRQINTSPAMPYGAAMGPDGSLWVTSSGVNLAKVDTETLEITQYTAPEGRWFYGITVDRDGFVWLSGGDGAQLFDPDTEEYERVQGGPGGVGLIDPETLELDVAWDSHAAFANDYIRPDTTGDQLVDAMHDLATYSRLFTGCEDRTRDTVWSYMHWNADVPPGTSLRFTARTSDTTEGLRRARQITIVSEPSDRSPVDLRELFDAAGVEHAEYLQIEASLSSGQGEARPTLTSFEVLRSCEGIIQ